MKFVSVHPGYRITVSSGTQRAVVHPSGVTEFMPNDDTFTAEFKLKTLSVAEIAAATEQLLSGPQGRFAFGSTPGRDEGNINILDAMDEGYTSTAHDGYDPYQNLSTFDTKDEAQCPAKWREPTEAYLLGHYEKERAYVRVDDYNITPPWPTYPQSGKVNSADLLRFAKAGGFLEVALEFELSQDDQRDGLISDLRAAVEEKRAAEEQEAALSAKV